MSFIHALIVVLVLCIAVPGVMLLCATFPLTMLTLFAIFLLSLYLTLAPGRDEV
jgi:hypothetical protein